MRFVLPILLCGLCVNTAQADTSGLRQQILKSAESVTAWQIEYDLVSPEMQRGDKVVHRTVALRYPDCLFHWTGNTTYQSHRTWQDDVNQQRTIVAGRKCNWDFPMRRASSSWDCDSKSLFPGSLPRELLWDVVLWWPFTTDSNHLLSSESYTVEDVLADHAYQFAGSTEQVGEHLCYVLRCDGKGALWFDCENPSILHKREWYQRAPNSVWRAELIDHQEIEPGIYCPKKITWTELPKHPTDERSAIIKQFSALIVSANFNEAVPKDLFDFPQQLPGHVESTDGGYQQVRAGANDYAESVIKWTQEHAGRPKPREISQGELAFHIGVYCFGSLLIFSKVWSSWASYRPRTPNDI